MKPFKRLQPLSLKKQIDDTFLQKLEGSMKVLLSCFTEITNRIHLPKNEQVSSLYKSRRQQNKSEEQHFNVTQNNIELQINNDMRKEDRFRNVLVKVPRISTQDKQAQTLQILNWVGVVCKEVLSVGFLMFKNGELEVNKIKAYCSENILRNLLQLAENYQLTQDQVQKINQSLRDEIFPYFCLKYPQSQQAEANVSLASELVESNNIDDNSNDLVYKSGVKFKLEKSGNYNTQIMQFINYLIKMPNAIALFKSDEIQQSLSVAEKFNRDMEKIFRKVQVQADVINMKKFDPKNPTNQPSYTTQKLQSQKEKQAYLQKVRSYTNYQIGRKLSENFKEFTENEIKSGNLRLKNSSIMRVVTKWCEELWGFFSEEGILGRESQFRMKNGGERFMKKFFVEVLNQLLQREKRIILKKLQQIQQNNYQHQSLFIKQGLNAQLKKFTEAEAKVGQFTTVIYRNYQNYLINYLNLLIHGINQAVHDFEKFVKVEKDKDWVLSQYRYRSEYTVITQEDVQSIMELIQKEGQIKSNVSDSIPELISFRIGDLLRCKCSSRQTQITAMYKQFQRISFTNPSLLKIVRVKNRLDRGNRDILMNLMYKQQLLVQVQLSIKFQKSKFITCSNQFNHFLYQLRRAEFGPISQMCSIWVNQDARSEYYLKFFEKTNSRKKKNNEDKKSELGQSCCNAQENLETVRLPFICKVCQCFYYHCSFTQKNSFCKKCQKVTCFLCQLQNYPTSQITQILPELKVNHPQSSLTFLTKIPQTGGAILNLKSTVREAKIFKTIVYNNQYMLFENANAYDSEKEIKIRLIQSFKSDKIPQSFLKQNIVYTSPEIDAIIPQITDMMAQEQYFIPKYFKQSQRASKTSVTQIGNNLTQQIFIKNSQITWPAAKKINFSQNKFQNIDILHEKFPNVKLAALSHNKITSISKQCERWKHLQVLYISHNKIKQVDPNIKHWRELIQLDFYQNQLEALPDQLCQLEKLIHLDLNCNHLKTLPNKLEGLKNLQTLNISNNWLQTLPPSLGSLKKLKKLEMYNSGLKQLPSTFGNLEQLQHFDAFDCRFQHLPQNIGKMKKLNYLRLQNNKLIGLCEGVGQLESLKMLNAEQNQIERVPVNMGGLKNLQILNLYQNKLLTLPQSIGEVINLTKIDLSYNKLQKIPDSIGNLQKLRDLALSNNKLKSFNPNICKCISLKKLFIDSNQIESIPNQIEELKNLYGLGLDSNSLVDGALPQGLKNMKNILGLGLSNNKLTTIPQFIIEMTWLNQLNFQNLPIKHIPKQMLNLKQLAYFSISESNLTPQSKQILTEISKICKANYKNFIEKRTAEMQNQQAAETQ